MSGKIEFYASYYGFSGELFTVEKPDDWEEMSEVEKSEWAKDMFFSEFDWYWGES